MQRPNGVNTLTGFLQTQRITDWYKFGTQKKNLEIYKSRRFNQETEHNDAIMHRH